MGRRPIANGHRRMTRWMYRTGQPNQVAAALNCGWAVVGTTGIWRNRLVTLEVPGRRTGRIVSFPLVIADHEGGRYLVAMLGEGTAWVANVRAAAGRAVLRHSGRSTVRLAEVDPADRAPILRRYLRVAPGARPHVPIDRHADLAEFERIAAHYPVFRIEFDTA